MNIFYLLPALTLITITFGLPIIRYFWISFHASSLLTGLEYIPNYGSNWLRIIGDDRFWRDTIQTLRFTGVSVSIELIIAILIALLLNQKLRGRGVIRAISFLPWALPTAVMALGWRWIFNSPYGPIDQLLNLFGFASLNILSEPRLSWIGTVLADVWKTSPFISLILLAGLQTIPNDLYEAFILEGGTKRQAFFRITLPLLEPYILVSLLFRVAQAFGVFDLIQVMTGGGPAGSTESLAGYAYLNAMRFLDFGYSATIIVFSFIVLILVCLIGWITISNSKRILSS